MLKTTTVGDAAEDAETAETAGWFIVTRDNEAHVTDKDDVGFEGFPDLYEKRWEAEKAAMELAEREYPNKVLKMENGYIQLMIGPPQDHTNIKNGDDRILYSIVPAEYSQN